MNNYFTHKILYISTFDVGFGDFFSNANCLNYLSNIYRERVQFHYYINERIYERMGSILHSCLPCDKVFISPYDIHDRCFRLDKFKNLPRNYYDYVIVNHVTGECLNQILSHFLCKRFLTSTNIKTLDNFYEHFSVPDIFEKYDINDTINRIIEVIDGEFLSLFPFSTRYLASLNISGIKKIASFAEKKNIKMVVCGESFCPYTANSNMNQKIWEFVNSFSNSNTINIMGLGYNKLIQILEKSKYIFYSPTGAAMLGITNMVKNKQSYIIAGGDSPIMEDIASNKSSAIKRANSVCEFYPCGFNENKEKSKQCIQKNEPKCINEELNIIL